METLGNQQIAVNIAMKNCKNRRMFERYQTIKLSLEGYDIPQIASITGSCIKTVYKKQYTTTLMPIHMADLKVLR